MNTARLNQGTPLLLSAVTKQTPPIQCSIN